MKKLLFTSTVLLAFGIANAQNKVLTIQEAVLKGRTSLAPKRLQNIGFIAEGKKLAYIDKNQLMVMDENGKITYSLSSVGLNKVLAAGSLDTVSAFEGLKWK